METEKKQGERNMLYMWIRSGLSTSSLTLASTAVLSGYLLYAGLDNDQISSYLAFVPLVNLIISLLLSGLLSGVRQTVKAATVTFAASGVLTALYAGLFMMNGKNAAFYPLLMALGGVLSVTTAIRNVFDYKMPCEVMDIGRYSYYLSVGGVVSGLSGIGTGLVLTACYARFDFHTVSCGAFFTAGVLLLLAAAVNALIRQLQTPEPPTEKKSGALSMVFAVLRDKDFLALLLPNTLRGVGEAVMAMITVLAVRRIGIAESDSAVITTIGNIAMFASCIMYGFLAPRLRVPKLCLLGSLLFVGVIPAFMGGSTMFFVLYGIAYVGFNIISNALPDMIYQNVSPKIMSAFHTWRLALMTLGTTVATKVFGAVLDDTSVFVILSAGVGAYLFCSVGYYLRFGKRKRN